MMTIADFLRHLEKNKCTHQPLEGGNLTGVALILRNPANNTKHIFQIYKGGQVSSETVADICTSKLFIPLPNNF